MSEEAKPRKSKMEMDQVYFWTSTILDWKTLLLHHTYKAIIVNSLKHLQAKGKIRIYGFVIMPNHVHLLWEMLAMNGKEMPYASFQKFTAHEFQKELRTTNPALLSEFEVNEPERMYRFWQEIR